MKLSEFFKQKEEFNIGFIGGSITEGAAANPRTSRYSTQTLLLLSRLYGVTLHEINAGIGGTGSNLGLFRAERDLISKSPDLVFIEFSVNDNISFSARYHESLVRLLRAYRPELPIVFLYTLNKPVYADYYAKGLLSPLAETLEEVAGRYGIPTVPVAISLCRAMGSEASYGEYMSDNVHPNNRGHRVYAEAIAEALETAEFSFPSPEPLYPIVSEHPTMVTAEGELSFEGWKKSFNNFYGRFSTYFYANQPGTELIFEFEGSAIGIYNTIEKDSGSFLFSVDGGEWELRSTWDIYALQFNRVNYCILKDDLPYGHHTLRIRVSEEQPEKSEGTYIRIGAFLVG